MIWVPCSGTWEDSATPLLLAAELVPEDEPHQLKGLAHSVCLSD